MEIDAWSDKSQPCLTLADAYVSFHHACLGPVAGRPAYTLSAGEDNSERVGWKREEQAQGENSIGIACQWGRKYMLVMVYMQITNRLHNDEKLLNLSFLTS